ASGINIVFEQNGEIRRSAYGREPDFQFNVDRLDTVIRECDPDYAWPIRTLVFRDFVKKLFTWLLAVVSLILLGQLAFYAYGRKVGVNVDPAIIPSGYSYYQDVERAIKSNDTNTKLNVLLQGQVQGFENIRDILDATKWRIAFLSIALIIVAALNLIRRGIVRLYPLSCFAFGHQKQVLARLQRKRELWFIVIALGFVVNVVAGLLVTISVK
ncbi:MAG TPA: hypothetical protein VGO68_01490, partial [Pyrinomonadaceae bacterium]|nr:hypothetical protein [Pyrinomonadaceae bacterium]